MTTRYEMATTRNLTARCASALLVGLLVLSGALPARAQVIENRLNSLKTVQTPEPANLNQFLITNSKGVITPAARAAAIALGKALFWDQAVGSDGQACASCHFNAGADSRTKNQVDPGVRAIPSQNQWLVPPPQTPTVATPPFVPNYQLGVGDFPFGPRFVNQQDHLSGIARDTQNVVSSQGVFNSTFGDITPTLCNVLAPDQPYIGSICDKRSLDPNGNGAVFTTLSAPATQVRNVEPRNTPSVINAVFNFRNFWDSRARNEFNGVNPIGDLDPYARVLMSSSNGSKLQKVSLNGSLRLENSSLASQSVGPALSDMEMSAQQRSFAKLGKKMLALPNALPSQVVSPVDSVLGNDKVTGVQSLYPKPGINKKYADLIQAAFQPQWYNSSLVVTFAGGTDADGTVKLTFSSPPKKGSLTTDQFTQMEFNFSLIWGIAIQMYEATLRADNSPVDQAFDATSTPLDPGFLIPAGCDDVAVKCLWGPKQKQGMNVFLGAGKCFNCHGGPETTNASFRNVVLIDGKLESMLMGNVQTATYDVGSYNTAVRRCDMVRDGLCDDAGIGATIGPLNLPLSMARFAQLVAANDPRMSVVCKNQPAGCPPPLGTNLTFSPLAPGARVAVDGAFKTPGLRNIELTAPYMHNGSELRLADVVDFYDRGANFPEYNIDNLDPDIGGNDPAINPIITKDKDGNDVIKVVELGLSDAEKASLVAFLKALTDERVRFQQAPFDHPQLFLPDLPPDANCPVPTVCKPGELPAVGQFGITVYGTSGPLPTFFQNLAQ